MSGTGEIRLNDIGTRLFFQFTDCGSPVDFTQISSVSSLALCLKPAVGDTKTFALSFAGTPVTLAGTIFAGDGSDGWTEYTIISSATWDEIGTWQAQGRVQGTLGDFRSQIKQFTVFGNICD